MQSEGHIPLVLTVPGLDNSGPNHWQTLWEATRERCLRVNLGQWHKPHRNSWFNQLNHAVRAVEAPVYLVAHSLGCLAVAGWAQAEPEAATLVAGALLVAPPEVDFFPFDVRLSSFSPTPTARLPFPATLVASRNDPYCAQPAARALARRWGAHFVDAGSQGHINADSGLGDWPEGQRLLDELIGRAGKPEPAQNRTSDPEWSISR